MLNPAMYGITPEQQRQAQEVGQHLKMEIIQFPNEGRVEIRFIKLDDDPRFPLPQTVENFAKQLAYGFGTMFGMTGKMITR
jgi:hypothetical protein